MSLKERIINGIIEREGPYVNDLDDSGGETAWGITLETARADGYFGTMKDLTKERAFKIYDKKFWQALMLDRIEALSVKVAEEIADTAANQGPFRAGEFLQRSLNVLNDRQNHYPDIAVDGKVGPGTVETLRLYLQKRGAEGEIVLRNMLNCLQGAFYVELAERRQKDEKFIFGWFKNRIVF